MYLRCLITLCVAFATLSCSEPKPAAEPLNLTIDASTPTPCLAEGSCAEACEQADGQACFENAMLKAQANGALFDPSKREKLNEARDFPRALELLKSECQSDNLVSCYLAGQLCYMGLGGYLDQLCALSSFEKSCLGGVIQGCTQLGKIYESGRFVAQDSERAARYLNAACGAGDPSACR